MEAAKSILFTLVASGLTLACDDSSGPIRQFDDEGFVVERLLGDYNNLEEIRFAHERGAADVDAMSVAYASFSAVEVPDLPGTAVLSRWRHNAPDAPIFQTRVWVFDVDDRKRLVLDVYDVRGPVIDNDNTITRADLIYYGDQCRLFGDFAWTEHSFNGSCLSNPIEGERQRMLWKIGISGGTTLYYSVEARTFMNEILYRHPNHDLYRFDRYPYGNWPHRTNNLPAAEESRAQ